GHVNEYVLAAVLRLDEAVAFHRVEPFDRTDRHSSPPRKQPSDHICRSAVKTSKARPAPPVRRVRARYNLSDRRPPSGAGDRQAVRSTAPHWPGHFAGRQTTR